MSMRSLSSKYGSNRGITKIQSIIIAVLIVIVIISGVGYYLSLPTLTPREKRVYRETFVWPNTIDPCVGLDRSSLVSLGNLYDRFTYPGKDGMVPSVAESWEISPDGLNYTFHLRQGIKFHDGSELTAEDVVFSMDRLLDMGEGVAYIFLGRVESAKAVDDYKVEFKMQSRFGPFLLTLEKFFIMNKDLVMANIKTPGPYGEYGDYGRDWLLTHDAGSGPYKVKEFRVEEELVMELFEDYWGEVLPNAPEEVHFIGTTEPIVVRTMMTNRELECTSIFQSDEALAILDEIEGVDLFVPPMPALYSISLNTKKPPLDDIHFCKAMFYAFDYERLKEIFEPYWGKYVEDFIATNVISNRRAGVSPKLRQPPSRNLTRAIEELKKSKYYDQLDQLVIEHHWVAEVPVREKISLLFVSSMADVGIEVRSVKTPWLTMLAEMGTLETSAHTYTVGVAADYVEALSELKMRFHSSSAKTYMQNEWLLNETIDGMIDDAEATIDTEARTQKSIRIQETLFDMYVCIPLVEWVFMQAYQAYYVDIDVAYDATSYAHALQAVSSFSRLIQVYPEKRRELLG